MRYEPNPNLNIYECSFKLPNKDLSAYFGRVKRGYKKELRTPFAGGKDVPLINIIKQWDAVYNKYTLDGKLASLHEFEMKMRDKVGPLSIMKPLKDRIVDINNYYDDIKLEATPILNSAVEHVCRCLRTVRGTRRWNFYSTVNDMDLSKNSGNPLFKKKNEVVKQSIPLKLDYHDGYDWVTTSIGTYLISAILGWRGQEGGIDFDDVKQRVIWMMNFSLNIYELSMYKPLILRCQRDLLPVWKSNDAVDRKVTALFDTKGNDDYVICTDFKRFDQHFNPMMQVAAKEVIKYLCPSESWWIENVYPIKYRVPIICSPTQWFIGVHGMASGSGGTNFDETMAHMCLQHESALLDKQELNPNSQCLGDDGILTYHHIDVDRLLDHYTQHGLIMEPSKQDVSLNNAIFLRRWYSKYYRVANTCVGVYSTYRALGRLCEQERFYDPDIWSKEMVCLRYLSILENVRWHPLREQFADFVIERDKYRLGLDIPGFYENIDRKYHESIDLITNFMSYSSQVLTDKVGISDWWIVKYMKSKQKSR